MIEKRVQKKNLRTRILAAFLAIIIMTAAPFEMQVDNSAEYVGLSIERTKAQAADVITVKTANASTLKKIHAKLSKGKAITLKVRGNESKSKSLLRQVNNKIKKVNKQGVVFEYKKDKTAGGYTYYTINSDQAGTYQYAIKYIKKLYSLLREWYLNPDVSDTALYYHDVQLYPDETTRKLHWAYDYLVENIYPNEMRFDEETYVPIDSGSYDAKTTSCNVYLDNYNSSDYQTNKQLVKDITYTYTFTIVASYDDRLADETKEVTIEYPYPLSENEKEALIEQYRQEAYNSGAYECFVYIDRTVHASGYTYEEFSKQPIAQKLIKKITCYSKVLDADLTICKTQNFCDLSDALKVYAIAASGYFNCNYGRPQYGMIYDYTWAKYYGKKGMSILYNNKAVGVCEVFATYECQVWDALGIQNYLCASYHINHAWSVVKVKNSVGKVMWIPFDYGIGPSEGLAVDDATYNKYLKTEAMRYKLYLSSIKGAPKKKNFKDSDFK